MINYIPFRSALFIVVPEFRNVREDKRSAIIDQARLSSRPRIQKFAGWAFFLALALPFMLLLFLFYFFGFHEPKFLLIPILSGLSALLASFLYSIFLAIILSPEIRRFI
ncbi:hypothetical protein [Collimonas sp.]|jgi:hypothetical protein|uniref:hypothetical protein n=1 Tax=Collimonas sp. TaxID=1963772 RepID=UPI002BF993C0|nr:hypothetical protein [Collimonas sp.]HWW05732.1 hypothetical protein [Collimonas sp.]